MSRYRKPSFITEPKKVPTNKSKPTFKSILGSLLELPEKLESMIPDLPEEDILARRKAEWELLNKL